MWNKIIRIFVYKDLNGGPAEMGAQPKCQGIELWAQFTLRKQSFAGAYRSKTNPDACLHKGLHWNVLTPNCLIKCMFGGVTKRHGSTWSNLRNQCNTNIPSSHLHHLLQVFSTVLSSLAGSVLAPLQAVWIPTFFEARRHPVDASFQQGIGPQAKENLAGSVSA